MEKKQEIGGLLKAQSSAPWVSLHGCRACYASAMRRFNPALKGSKRRLDAKS
jgi:hypothetical protein